MKMTHWTLAILMLLGGAPLAGQHPAMPAGLSHAEHLRQIQQDEQLKQRGNLAMGFDQDKADHHFLLRGAGGAIVVTSKDANDAESIARIRSHFREIAVAFARGLFDKPVATHKELPPGAEAMAANRSRITYRYEERAGGAALMIETADADALKGVHDFLRYQIVEHKTGDPLTPQR
jgi:hypothetical protein